MATTTAYCTRCDWSDHNCRPIYKCPICGGRVEFEWDYDIDEGDYSNEDDE